jgi:nitroreductase
MATVAEAVLARRSVRAFLDRPVDRATVAELLAAAGRAPSGGNLQPGHVDVLAGAALAALKEKVRTGFAAAPAGEGTLFPVYPPALGEPWRSRRFASGEQLYAAIGIPRGDRPARLAQFAHNYDLFGAPVGLFFSIPKSFGPPQWAHLGMFMQTFMLLAEERGLATCAQEAWALVHKTVGGVLGLPEDRLFYCGMALGYADENHPINSWRTDREPLESFATFAGF